MRVYPEVSLSTKTAFGAMSTETELYRACAESADAEAGKVALDTTTTAKISTVPTIIETTIVSAASTPNGVSSSGSNNGVPEESVVESWFKGKRVLVVDDGKEKYMKCSVCCAVYF